MNLGQRLRQLRIEKNMTQAQLAKQFNLAESTISLYENNKRSPDYDVLQEMSHYFNVSTDFLLGYSMQKNPPAYVSNQNIPMVTDVYIYKENVFTGKKEPFWFGVGQTDLRAACIMSGDLLLIEPSHETSYHGAFYLVQIDDLQPEICQIVNHEHFIIVLSLDPTKKPLVINHQNQKKIRVFGKVLELRRNFIEYS